jgi:hypothetical protein
MRRQIIAKINNIANQLDSNGFYVEANVLTNVMKKLAFDRDLDDEGSYDEMFGPMNEDRDKEGKIIVSYTEDEDNPYQSKYTVSVYIDGKFEESFNTFEDEDGRTRLLNNLNKANEMADMLKAENEERYPDVEFELHKLAPKRYNPRIPGDFERD